MREPSKDRVDQSATDAAQRRANPLPGPSTPVREVRGEVVRGHRPGEQYVRVFRPFARGFQRREPGLLVAREEVLEPTGGIARAWNGIRRVLIGPRLPSAHEMHERLTKPKALAIFASDALSSVAYGPEAIMRVLVLAGVGALALTVPVAISITILLIILITSYQQTIQAYPSGGGSYVVASENLGTLPGLVAAAALLTDYILTVAVSIAAGITALTSAFPGLFPFKVDLTVLAVLLVMLANLRGVRESGTIFAVPAYGFIASVLGLIALGFWRIAIVPAPILYTPPSIEIVNPQPLTYFLVLSAFAQGCASLTGIEAVANGVQAFKPPESLNARITLISMGALLGTMVLGISFLVTWIGVIPDPTEQESVVSQLARSFVGTNWFYYLLQFMTALILVLAANTSFAGFPRLASILAQDGFLPRQFTFRGERLAFSTGIVFLAAAAIVLLIVFQGSVDRLIPLYAVGVFTAFTLSQAGMLQHWRRLRELGWRRRALINAVGAATTAVVVTVIAVTKFQQGAWMVIVLVPVFVLVMLGIHLHYETWSRALAVRPGETILSPSLPPAVVVPVSRIDRPTMAALSFARSISTDVTAVHVSFSRKETQEFRACWEEYRPPAPLVIVDSPYRALVEPLLAYIDAVDRQDPRRPVTVVLPEFVPRHWWEYPLHNQSALRLKLRLFFRPNTIVVDVPYVVGVGFEGESRR